MSTQSQLIPYFGFGSLRSREMIKAVTGRDPEGIAASIRGYELVVQSLKDLDPEVAHAMDNYWGADFKIYRLRQEEDGLVAGTVWYVTPQEYGVVKRWEGVGRGSHTITAEARDICGNPLSVKADAISKYASGEVVGGVNYETYLNDRQKMLDTATEDRETYLKEHGQTRKER